MALEKLDDKLQINTNTGVFLFYIIRKMSNNRKNGWTGDRYGMAGDRYLASLASD